MTKKTDPTADFIEPESAYKVESQPYDERPFTQVKIGTVSGKGYLAGFHDIAKIGYLSIDDFIAANQESVIGLIFTIQSQTQTRRYEPRRVPLEGFIIKWCTQQASGNYIHTINCSEIKFLQDAPELFDKACPLSTQTKFKRYAEKALRTDRAAEGEGWLR